MVHTLTRRFGPLAALAAVWLGAGCTAPPADEKYRAGLSELLAGRSTAAEAHFRDFLASDASSRYASDAHYFLGGIALQRGSAHEAETHFRAALLEPRTDEVEAGAALGLARCDYLRGAYRQCMAACRGFLDHHASSPRADEALFLYAEAADREGLTTEARSYYRQVAERFPSGAWAPKAEARLSGAKPPPPTASPGGQFTVQVAALSSPAKAAEHVSLLRQRGYPADVVPVQAEGQTLHTVRIGPYATRAEAERVADKLKASGMPALVKP